MSKSSECFETSASWFLSKYLTWLVLWKFNNFDHNVPTFTAWETDNRTKSMEFGDVKKTLKMLNFNCMFLSCHVHVSEWIHTL